jgi:hypothetical protein
MAESGRRIRWLALILSFIGAVFVGPALALGATFIIIAFLTVLTGNLPLGDTVGTTLAVAGSGVLFLVVWWVFYRLAKRSLD